MSSAEEPDVDGGTMQVVDEEGEVDRKRKNWILNLREQVAEFQTESVVGQAVGADDASAAYQMTQHVIRQYLVAIEPLLADENIPKSNHYYREVKLGEVELEPPEKWRRDSGRPTREDLRRGRDMDFLRSDPPTAERVPIYGLKEVIENDTVSKTWEITVDDGGIPRDIEVADQRLIPGQILFDAVRKADIFLQQAGVGFEIGHEERDEKETEPF